MPSKLGNSLIAMGAIAAFAGLLCLPAAMHDRVDSNVLGMGLGLFSAGMLLMASGFYLNARQLSSQAPAESAAPVPAPAARPRGGCELCGMEAPVIFCKTHELHMCGACLARHYDVRSCAYVPTTRRDSAKAMAKGRGF